MAMSGSLFYCSSIPPSTQVALRRAGYQSLDELSSASAETLSKGVGIRTHNALFNSISCAVALEELGIDIANSQALISATQVQRGVPLSQSVASLSRSVIFKCSYSAVNKILGGGLPRGHILEISGPPGSFKETLALDFVRVFAQQDEGVIFVDMQNMTTPKAISNVLADTAPHYDQRLIRYARLHKLPDLLIFMHNLLAELRPTTGLLVLNSISFPFQSQPDLLPSRKTALLGVIRQSLLQACVSNNLTIVVTSQMATKMLSPSGSAATFDNGAKAVIMPQLGSDYLPSGRSYRLVIVPQSRTAGVVRLLSSPSGQRASNAAQETYTLTGTITV